MKVLKCCAVAVFWLGLCVGVFAQSGGTNYKKLYGVDAIQPGEIQLTREQMRKLFIVSDAYSESVVSSIDQLKWHNEAMRDTACAASVMPCDDHNDLSTTPFTFLAKYPLLRYEKDVTEWIVREAVKRGSKIVTESQTNIPVGNSIEGVYGSSVPFVLVAVTGNSGVDNFFTPFTYDRLGNRFTRNGRTVTGSVATGLRNLLEMVRAQKVIYTSSYTTSQGVPKRNDTVTGCLGVEESCVSLPIPTPDSQGGTSPQSPTLGAAMASVLGVFPQYDAFDLAALVNSCAQHFPSIVGGVVDMPCVIETICEETNSSSPVCGVEFPGPVFNDSRIGVLENPGMTADMLYAERSGISAISGWVCDAEEIVIELNGEPFRAGYGTTRTDTQGECGDSDNGFSLLHNWNLLGDGLHSVKAYADGTLFASTKVKVTTLGEKFVRLPKVWDNWVEFPGRGGFTLQWSNSLQNLVITDGTDIEVEQGYNTVSAVHGYLENPSLGSFQSGISAISGWVCEAEEIVIELNGEPFTAGYGTTRADTQGECGDSDNGFSLLHNWNLLGDGIHSVKAYADGVLFASTQVKVTTLGEEFVRGAEVRSTFDLYKLADNPDPIGPARSDFIIGGHIEWWEATQNFVIVGLY